MKKKLIILLFGLLLFSKIYSKENIILKCSESNVRLSNYLEKSKTPVVFIGNDYNTYYTWNKDNKCKNITTQEMLDLYNQEQTTNTITYENNNKVLHVSKYKFNTSIGYYINKNEYDKNNEYYYLNEETNSIALLNDEYKKEDKYYLKGYFRHVLNEKMDEKKEYYSLIDPNNSIYELINNDEIKNKNIVSIFELVSLKDTLISEKKYSMDNTLIEKIINENIKEDEMPESNLIEINDNIYLNIIYKNKDGKIRESFLFDSSGKLLENYNNKIFDVINKNIVVYDKNYKKYQIINEKFKVIKELEFEEENTYNMAYTTEDGIYLSLSNKDVAKTYFYEIENKKIYMYILMAMSVLILSGIVCLFIIKKKRY